MLVFAIMADTRDPIGWLGARLAGEGVVLDGDGAVRGAAGEGATWRARDVGELMERAWHRPLSPCPFVPPLAGYVELAGAVSVALARAFARAGRGVVARLDDDRAHETVALREVEVDGAIAPDGLDGGELLLERDEDGAYAADVLARIAAAAAARGLRTALAWRAARRNPVDLYRVQPFGSDQLYPPVWGSGGTSIDPLRALHGLTVALWLRDLSALASLVAPAP